ncbi:MAG: 23S rRNA (adenine(2030)-N(6))-methyltransferase RlmJ [Proteobacteria bacterium]|nr:23S rRNA (adenine(2030)-N(6))-methyltransferase RlmJ [Pseudomonadota bacterium]
MKKKPNPFCYIDTHAGEGLYDLKSEAAVTTGEYLTGVQHFISSDMVFPEYLQSYLQVLQYYQVDGKQRFYPGSPFLASHLLRLQDKMIINEFHPSVYTKLKENFRRLPAGNIIPAIHNRDAYEFLPAILPDPIKRGLVLIDPPFEQKDEGIRIKLVLEKALKRWPQGIYLVWYPITALRKWDLKEVITYNQISDYLIVQMTIAKPQVNVAGLIGCQMLLVNPPWKIAEILNPLMELLWKTFSTNQEGGWEIYEG